MKKLLEIDVVYFFITDIVPLVMANQDDSDRRLSKALGDYWCAIKTSRRKDARTEVERYVIEILDRIEAKESRFKMEMVLRDSLFDQTDISEKTCRFDYDLPITQLSIKELATEIPQDTTTCTLWVYLVTNDNGNLNKTAECLERGPPP